MLGFESGGYALWLELEFGLSEGEARVAVRGRAGFVGLAVCVRFRTVRFWVGGISLGRGRVDALVCLLGG